MRIDEAIRYLQDNLSGPAEEVDEVINAIENLRGAADRFLHWYDKANPDSKSVEFGGPMSQLRAALEEGTQDEQ